MRPLIGGAAIALAGVVALGIGIPLYLQGAADVDRARTGATASLATVRF